MRPGPIADPGNPEGPLTLKAAIARVAPPPGEPGSVRAHLDALTKPPGSLGRLEELALQVGVALGDPPPPLEPAVIFVFVADHGVAARGVSAYPAEVTAQMCANFSRGGAAINVLGRQCGADVRVVDVGVASEVSNLSGIEHRKVRAGTDDLSEGPAMALGDVEEALETGLALGAAAGARLGPVWLMAALPYVTGAASKSRLLTRAGWPQGVLATGIAAGGVTGDFPGAAEQIGEMAILLAVLALAPPSAPASS